MNENSFSEIFNKARIYTTLFFDVRTSLISNNLDGLKEINPELFDWVGNIIMNKDVKYDELCDLDKYYIPELHKISLITVGFVEMENGVMNRTINKLYNSDEYNMILQFFDVLTTFDDKDVALCGYDIVDNVFPILFKRFFYLRELNGDNRELPNILKKYLQRKPWDGDIIDVKKIWNLNSMFNTKLIDLNLISHTMGLKKTIKFPEKYEASTITDLKQIGTIGSNYVNVCIQFFRKFREM